MSLFLEDYSSRLVSVPDASFSTSDNVGSWSSGSDAREVQYCGDKRKRCEDDIGDGQQAKKRKLNPPEKQHTNAEQKHAKELWKKVTRSHKRSRANLSGVTNHHKKSSAGDAWMQGQGFKRKICDYYHDEGVIDGEPALKKAAIYSDEACRKIWRIGSAMNTRKARKQALVHIGNTRYSAMSKVLRDLRPVSETEVKQDNRRVSVNAECVMAQYPTSRSAHTYSPSSEDDELNLLWYAKQDPMKITKQSKEKKLPRFREDFLKRCMLLRVRDASVCLASKHRPMEVFDKLQRVRFENLYGEDQKYHSLKGGRSRMVPYEQDTRINFNHVPYGMRSGKQLEKILGTLDPKKINRARKAEYRAGKSPLTQELEA